MCWLVGAVSMLALLAPPARAADPQPPRLDARTWVLVDPRDGEQLAARAPARRVPIASATKLMTAYLALHRLEPGHRLRAPAYRALPAESLLGLRAGERMTVRDLLYALILRSANDAAATIATGISGSERRFVREMNRFAAAQGLGDTHFTNPIGFDDPGNYSSAHDLVELTTKLLANPLFGRIADAPTAVLRSGAGPRRITTRNTLVGRVPWITGVKTGHTLGAGYVLVGSGRQNGTTLVSAVLGAPSEATRDSETLKLLRYGFSLYRPSTPVARGERLAEPGLSYRDEDLPLVAARSLQVSARRGQHVETVVEAPEELGGPIERGERLGRVVVTVDGHPAAESPLLAERSASAATLRQKVVATVQDPLLLIPGGLIVIVVGVLLASRGRRPARALDPEHRRPPRRSPEERRIMHQERMRKRRRRAGRPGDGST